MRLLISGGCKMGKSTVAQRLAVAQGMPAYYVATMRPRDDEDLQRISRHRQEREGWGFETIECATQVERIIRTIPAGASLLLDSTTALLAEEMFTGGAEPDEQGAVRARDGLLSVLDAFSNIVFVSDAIYSDARVFDPWTERYRQALAEIDRSLARACDAVIEMVMGQPILHKGDERVAGWLASPFAGAGDGAGAVYGSAGIRPLG